MQKPGEKLAGWGRFNRLLSIWFEYIAIAGILGMIVATTIDVVGSKLFHWPLPAGTEIVYLLQVIAIAGTLAISQIDGRHVRIENIDRVPKRSRDIIHAVTYAIGLALFIILCWKAFQFAVSLKVNNEVTSTARVAVFPFASWLALSCIPMSLVLLRSLVTSVLEALKK
jgi:TRAP-type C4-dicarboxylate transport system permease small subunit